MFITYGNETNDDAIRTDYEYHKAWGLEALINLKGCSVKKMQDGEYIRRFLKELVSHIDMKAYGEPVIERFGEGNLFGFSAVQLIYTSCITMHFSEVDGRVFIDIFSCKSFGPDDAAQFCAKWFDTKDTEVHSIIRS